MKNMLKITMLLCLMLAVMLTAAACLPKTPTQQTTPEVTTPSVTTPTTTTPESTTPENTTPAEKPEIPEDEGEIYALYTEVCKMLQKADHFSSLIEVTDVYYMWYNVAGEDMYVMHSDYEDNSISQWFIDQVGYQCINYETVSKVAADETFFEMFDYFEENFPFAAFAQNKIQNLSCSYIEGYNIIMIEFDYVGKLGYSSLCKYFFSADMSSIEVSITEFADGAENITAQYYFNINPDIEIELPER